jgi:hypothetical protein
MLLKNRQLSRFLAHAIWQLQNCAWVVFASS